MPGPKILVIPGSLRTGSYNVKLAALAVKELTLNDAEVTRISLADYPMPIYDGDHEAHAGPPETAVRLKRMIAAHHGVFIATPEYNASVAPLLKNAIDWVSRVRERNEAPCAVFKERVFALGSASPQAAGGLRSLIALRQILELGCGAIVLPEQVAVQNAERAFDERDNIADLAAADALRAQLARLVEMARLMM